MWCMLMLRLVVYGTIKYRDLATNSPNYTAACIRRNGSENVLKVFCVSLFRALVLVWEI